MFRFNKLNPGKPSTLFIIEIWLFIILFGSLQAKEIHVSVSGDDMNTGTLQKPFRTINKAADVAQPGDVVTVHSGTYREWVKPARGGASALQPVIFRAATGENVFIKGSERINHWALDENGLWKIEIPESFFGQYNPFVLTIKGAWLTYGIDMYHRGGVFINDNPLLEKLSLDSVFHISHTWYTETQEGITSIWANFRGSDPNIELTEISLRECVFFPEITDVNFVTVDGFHIMHSSENWAPPGSHQKGAIGTNWGYGWVIENCTIADAKCVGICIGNVPGFVDKNIDVDKFEHYLIPNVSSFKDHPGYKKDKKAFIAEMEMRSQRALQSLRNAPYADMHEIGRHIIRNNVILRCGQSGIAGEGGNKFSLIEGNFIEQTNYTRQFGGWETAAIKFHAPVDVVIRNNCIRGVYGIPGEAAFGIWLDWEAQGTRISGNVISGTDNHALYFEVSHGPILVDNNVIIGGGVLEHSEGGIFTHNLFYQGKFVFVKEEDRITPYYTPHTVEVSGYAGIAMKDDKWFSNIFIGGGLQNMFEAPGYISDYNIFLQGAEKSIYDENSLIDPFDTKLEYQAFKSFELCFELNASVVNFDCPLITYDLIGKVTLPGMGIEHPDGSPITIDGDYFANPRGLTGKVTAGPFLNIKEGKNNMVLWPRN